ncbi:hypothetical protein AB0F68_25020, partial [Micromonospora sp. NPDC023966]
MASARPHTRPSRRTLLIGAGAGAATLAAPGLVGVASARGSQVDTVLEWYDVTAATIGVITGPLQVNSSRTWAIGWIAAWRAVTRARWAGVRARLEALPERGLADPEAAFQAYG